MRQRRYPFSGMTLSPGPCRVHPSVRHRPCVRSSSETLEVRSRGLPLPLVRGTEGVAPALAKRHKCKIDQPVFLDDDLDFLQPHQAILLRTIRIRPSRPSFEDARSNPVRFQAVQHGGTGAGTLETVQEAGLRVPTDAVPVCHHLVRVLPFAQADVVAAALRAHTDLGPSLLALVASHDEFPYSYSHPCLN